MSSDYVSPVTTKVKSLDIAKVRALSDLELKTRITSIHAVVTGLTSPEDSDMFKEAIALVGSASDLQSYRRSLRTLNKEKRRRELNPNHVSPRAPWTPFTPAQVDPGEFYTPEAEERFRVLGEKSGRTMEEMRTIYLSTMKDEIYLNSRYQVALRRDNTDDGEGNIIQMVHLSIKSRDPKIYGHDWRDFQRIKNELVGPECEGIELYPAESRLIDTADQWHIWCVNSGSFRWPIGWNEGRLVMDPEEMPRGVGGQREFEA